MKLKTLKNIRNLHDKRVLIRVDFNVPFKGKTIEDDIRIRQALPTVKYLAKKGAKVILITHLGRPKGPNPAFSVGFIARHLEKLLNKKVKKLDDCVGKNVKTEIAKMKPGDIALLENVRFHKGEETCDRKFTKELAALGEIFVNDAFGASHRAHSSTSGLAAFLPAYAGFLLEKEISALESVFKKSARPITLIMGGAKIADKIGVIKHFLHKADFVLVGGALANTFLAAEGYDIAKSYYEPEKIKNAQEIMLLAEKYKEKFIAPVDAVVADEINDKAPSLDLPIEDIEGNMKILDIGSLTQKKYADIIKRSKTVVWNGPMGVFEHAKFAAGTKTVAKALASRKGKAKVYIGGGDTLDALKKFNIPYKKFTHVSTGGGAMLKFLEGKIMPGIKILYG